ncbi:CG42313 [Drosophila busckii]|uniref:CG42313 n=1 Tax=Drosophila busckii TaxID=30019 RepID=A0A0M4ERC3_DROBS|nr:CG42313 [Drosophila busckii]
MRGKVVHYYNCFKTKDIDAVEGKSVSLPCPIAEPLNDVYMVLWFRDNAGIPLYSFDVRDSMAIEQPRHWSAPEVFGSRAKLHLDTQPATLEIKDIKRHDQGIYRCRVDFRTTQTQSFRFNLSVIILPEQPLILDRWGRQLNGTQLGPKQEGDDIVITCRVVGGRPQPQVRWLVNGLLVDNQNEHNSGDVIENRLLWPSVQRNDLNSVFTCQALNTQLDKPKEKSFILDMHLKPLTVKIVDPPNSMTADRRYEVTCESSGSRPAAIITWYKGKRQLRRTKDDISKNSTRSELSFVPTTDDDGKSITCRAENPNVNGLYLETMWKLNVVYPPLVELHLGSTLAPDDIKEGDDVYFECHVHSNPQWRKLLWLHNGIHLEHNTSARVIRSNQSLVLQKITKHYAGNYACSAINDEGETVSNQLPLRVKYTPVCKHTDRVILIGASKDETVEVVCEIQADPPPRTFRWKFNNSGETLDVGSERFSVNGSRSILKYTPVTDQDYGTLSCWAANEVGTQQQPCLFQVVLAALPNAVANCTVFNRTELSVDIQCVPGYDGGLPQIFVLEMFSSRTGLTSVLTVEHPPLVELHLGSTLAPDDIKEGDDVYFECHVHSNPQWRKLLWLHNGIHLEHNTSARVIRSNQSLVLQKITKHYAGNYACSAINDEGETVSNQLPLRVKYTPVCKHTDRVILIGASKDETVEVVCEIQADPPPRTFRWKFNNSGETLDVGSERFSVNGSRSILKYTPVTDQDYGTLSCWAANEVGTQQQPCLFQVVLAALPNAVANCTVFNRTELSVDIQCVPGYDGGLPQIFVLEMFSSRTGLTRFNVSNADEALFSLENMDTLTSMMMQENNSLRIRIYSYNQKGRSAAYLLPDFIIGSAAYKTDDDVTLTLSPVIVGSVLTIIIIGVAIAIRIFVVTFLHNLRSNRQHGNKATAAGVVVQSGDVFKSGNLEKPRWQHTDIKTKSSEDLVEDERDPDVIPSQYVGGSSAGSSGSNASNVGSTTAGTTGTGSSTSTAVAAAAADPTADRDAHQFAAATPSGIGAGVGVVGSVSKWSPNGTAAAMTTTTALTSDPVNAPVTYNQINTQRAQLLAAVTAGGGGCSSSVISPSSSIMSSLTGAGVGKPHGVGTLVGSPTSLSSTATLAAHLQPAHSSGVGTLPPGLGSGGGYIMNAYASGRLHHAGSAGVSHMATLNRHHAHQQQQQHHHPGSGSSLLLGSVGSVMGVGVTASTTATTSCNSSQDLDDNININAIKDCLMTQRVPESCV